MSVWSWLGCRRATPSSKPPGDCRYWAFVSYSQSDTKRARRLHRYLERYRFPRRLRGWPTVAGTVPVRARPAFLDREELAGAPSLPLAIQAALAESASLVVVCSPHSARSRWVNQEVETYLALGRRDRVFCYVVEGEPRFAAPSSPDPTSCLPSALGPGAADQPEAARAEPLACDARRGKDGKRRARLKLLAGIVQIPFDELWRRERRRRVRNRTIVAVLAAAMAAFSYGMYWFLAAHAKARGLFTDISLAAEPLTFNSRIADAVWELSQSSYGVRMAALQIAASGAGGASVFLGYRDEILHAAVGLQPATRRALAGDVLDDCYGGAPEHDYTRAACAALVAALDGGSLRATRYFLERTLGKYPDLTLRGYHAPSLQDVVTGLSGKDAATVFAEALEELARAPGQDLDRLHVLAYGLVEIVRRLPAPDAARASERLLELTRDPRHTPRLPELALVLAARPGMLEAPAATRLHQLVRAQVTRRDRLFVEEALASVVRRMSREDRLAAFRSVYDGLLSGDPAWRWRELPQDEQDLPAEFWREVLASLRKAWRTASDPEQLNLIAAGLGPVPTHLCEREAAEAFDRLLSVTRAGERSKVSLGLRYAAHKLSAGDATLASRRVIGIMSQERDLDPEVLAAIPGPVEAAFVMPAFRTLLDQYSKDPQLGAYSIPPRMAALAGKMNPEAAAYFFPAVAKLQEKLERPTEFADVVLAIASALDAKHAPGARADLLHVLARMPEPPCKVLLPFISRETLPVMIEVLKWPTCPATDRDRIIEKIGGVVGRSFGSTNTAGLFRADLWGFAAWAEKQGFDLKSPPRRSIQFPPAATASQAPVP